MMADRLRPSDSASISIRESKPPVSFTLTIRSLICLSTSCMVVTLLLLITFVNYYLLPFTLL